MVERLQPFVSSNFTTSAIEYKEQELSTAAKHCAFDKQQKAPRTRGLFVFGNMMHADHLRATLHNALYSAMAVTLGTVGPTAG